MFPKIQCLGWKQGENVHVWNRCLDFFFFFNMFFSLRSQINFLKPRFNIEFDLVIFQVLPLHPQPGWAFLECCHSAGQDGWCFFISECHISGRFNVVVWLRSQKEAKRFHYQQTWNRSFLLNPHFTELMEAFAAHPHFCYQPVKNLQGCSSCRSSHSPGHLSPAVCLHHTTVLLGTLSKLYHCWVTESLFSNTSHFCHKPQLWV